MDEKIKKVSLKILEFLNSDDPNYRANTMVDCANEDELPIVLLGLIDSDQTVRLVAADVIGLEPHNFIEAKLLLEKLYDTEQNDEVKINMLGTLKKWGSTRFNDNTIVEEFKSIVKGKDQNFVNWAKLKLRIM